MSGSDFNKNTESMQITIATVDVGEGIARIEPLEVPEGCSVSEALKLWGQPFEENRVAVFTKKVTPDHVLQEGDRIDIGTKRLIDPKKTRRILAINPKFTKKGVLARHGGKHQLIR